MPEIRSKDQEKVMKNYVMKRMALMEPRYCNKDDY